MEKTSKNPLLLVILDGFGYRKEKKGNAIANANMANWKTWLKKYPSRLIKASGKAVGLLPGYMGNSEVGHLTLGAGRIIESILLKFNTAINDGSFFKNKKLIDSLKNLKNKNKSLHLMGLLSDAGVHSHQKHLFTFLKLAKQIGIKNVYIHAFLDGRDTPPTSASKYLNLLQKECKKLGIGKIASIHGRFYAMDRDKNWERTHQSYLTLTTPNDCLKTSWQNALKSAHSNGESDEFVIPHLLISDGIIKQNDGIIFFNFRPDRARQLSECFINPKFEYFTKPKNIPLTFFISTSRYKKEFKKWDNIVLFEEEKIENTFLDVLAKYQKKVFIIAETEKYAHVTYFFRGMIDRITPNETRNLIPSIKAKNYINHPEMSANEITTKILESLKNNPKEFYLINYANADMVGHSANLKATIKSCECLDKQIKKLFDEVVTKQNGTLIIIGDHGNAEEMIDKKGNPKSSHTSNPVPMMIITKKNYKKIKLSKDKNLGLSNVAPTILEYMNLDVPKEMTKKLLF